MKTIYFDHNLLHYFVSGFPPNFNVAAEQHALLDLSTSAEEIRPAMSLWNLIEASREGPKERVTAMGDFIQSLSPLWIVDRLTIQKEELKQLIWHEFYGQYFDSPHAFVSSFTEVMNSLFSSHNLSVNDNSGELTAKDFLLYLADFPEAQMAIRQTESEHPHILETLQEAKARGDLRQTAAFTEFFAYRVPRRTPWNTELSESDLDAVIKYCVNNLGKVMHNCRAVEVEMLLSNFRMSNAKRKPHKQDAIDLMHGVQGLAYCNAFLTADRYLLQAAAYYSKRRTDGAQSFKSLAAALQYLTNC